MMVVISARWFVGLGLEGNTLVQLRYFPHSFLEATAAAPIADERPLPLQPPST